MISSPRAFVHPLLRQSQSIELACSIADFRSDLRKR